MFCFSWMHRPDLNMGQLQHLHFQVPDTDSPFHEFPKFPSFLHTDINVCDASIGWRSILHSQENGHCIPWSIEHMFNNQVFYDQHILYGKSETYTPKRVDGDLHHEMMNEIYFLPLLNICNEHVLKSLKIVPEHSLKSINAFEREGCIFFFLLITLVLTRDWHLFSPKRIT